MKLAKSPTFIEGIIVALIASFIGSIGYFALTGFFSESFIGRLLISGFSLGYIAYLLSRSKERIGRATTILVWFVVTISLWLSWSSVTVFLLLHLALIWLVRSLYFYSSLFSSLADLALNVLSIVVGIWALLYTNSYFLGIWCFFLTQALFTFIPTRIGRRQTNNPNKASENEVNFQRAYREAEAAVRKLSTY